MTHLKPGMPAPDFALPDQDGQVVQLSELRGSSVIVYFYPQAMTSACRQQTCDFSAQVPTLESHGYRVLGISRDPIEKLKRASDADDIRFPLLSDPDLAVHIAWGTYGDKQLYGKTVQGVRRSTFVVDAEGVLTHTFYNTKAKGHLAMLDKRLAFSE